MSSFLMLYIDEDTRFVPNQIKNAIASMDNADLYISKNETSEGTILYRLNNDSVNINIGEDWRFIAIEGTGDTALNFAIELNKILDQNLHLTDSNYSFLCRLNEVKSIKELEPMIAEGMYYNE